MLSFCRVQSNIEGQEFTVKNDDKNVFQQRLMGFNLKLDFTGLPCPQIYSDRAQSSQMINNMQVDEYLSSDRNSKRSIDQNYQKKTPWISNSIKKTTLQSSKSYSKLSEIIKTGHSGSNNPNRAKDNNFAQQNITYEIRRPSSEKILKFIQMARQKTFQTNSKEPKSSPKNSHYPISSSNRLDYQRQ